MIIEPDSRELPLSRAEESALAFLVQSCISDGLLAHSGLEPDLQEQMMVSVRSVSDRLLRRPRPCGYALGRSEVDGLEIYCSRPEGHERHGVIGTWVE